MSGFSHSTFKNIILNLVGKPVGRLLWILANFWLAHLLGPSGFGSFILAYTIFQLITLIGNLGLNAAILKFGARIKEKAAPLRVFYKDINRITILVNIIISLSLFASADYLGENLFLDEQLLVLIPIFSVGILFFQLININCSFLKLEGSMKGAVFVQDLLTPLFLVLTLAFIHVFNLKLSLELVTMVLIAGYLIGAILSAFLVYLRYPAVFHPGSTEQVYSRKSILSYALPTAFSGLVVTLMYWLDKLILGYFSSSAEVGLYQSAVQISMFYLIISNALSTAITPAISEFQIKGSTNELDEFFKTSTRWILTLTLPVFVVVVSFPETILSLLFGAAFGPGGHAMVILSIGQLVNATAGSVSIILIMLGLQTQWLKMNLLWLAVNIILNVWFIPIFGMNGAAYATAFSVAGMFANAVIFVRWKLSIWPYSLMILKPIVAATFTYAIIYFSSPYLLPDGLLKLLLWAFIALCIYTITLVILGLEPHEKKLINKTLSRK